VVEVEFDPDVVTYRELLEVFWRCHDPTTYDQQGDDVGPEYRSVIFFRGPDQEAAALASMEDEAAAGRHADPIVTELRPADTLWLAAPAHQRFFDRHGG